MTAAPLKTTEDRIRYAVAATIRGVSRKAIARTIRVDHRVIATWCTVARALGHKVPLLIQKGAKDKDPEIARLFGEGLGARQIAQQLNLKTATAQTRINIMQRAGKLPYRKGEKADAG